MPASACSKDVAVHHPAALVERDDGDVHGLPRVHERGVAEEGLVDERAVAAEVSREDPPCR